MIATASASVSAPATYAAATSPMLWPTTASGTTPHACHSAASATSIANSTGCTTSIRSSRDVVSDAVSSASTEKSASAAIAPSHASSAARNAGSSVSSCRPIPSHCAPWPGNTNTTLPGPLPAACPRTTPAGVSPLAASASAARNSSRERAATASRCSSALRVVAALKATSASPSSGCASRCAASRAACALTAAALLPDTTTSSADRAGASTTGATTGASSSTTCALVPLMPKELTAAKRGRFVRGQAIGSRATLTGSVSHGRFGLRSPNSGCPGIDSCCIARTALSRPAIPAAGSRCPRFAFADPRTSGLSAGRLLPYTAANACTSIGSPSGVPVPWHST